MDRLHWDMKLRSGGIQRVGGRTRAPETQLAPLSVSDIWKWSSPADAYTNTNISSSRVSAPLTSAGVIGIPAITKILPPMRSVAIAKRFGIIKCRPLQANKSPIIGNGICPITSARFIIMIHVPVDTFREKIKLAGNRPLIYQVAIDSPLPIPKWWSHPESIGIVLSLSQQWLSCYSLRWWLMLDSKEIEQRKKKKSAEISV